MLLKEKKMGLSYIIIVCLIVLLLLWLAARTFGQNGATSPNHVPVKTTGDKSPQPH